MNTSNVPRDEFVTQLNALISSVRSYGSDQKWLQVVNKLEEARTVFERNISTAA